MEYMQVSPRVMKYIHADHLSGYEVHAGQPTGSWSTCRSVQWVMKYMQIIHLVMKYNQVSPQGHGVHGGQSKGHGVRADHSLVVEYMQITPQGHGVHAGQSKGY
jgi:hypothetical protein